MQDSVYINFNGSIAEAGQPVLMHTNRAFRYGDALFESIRLMNGEILFFDRHLERLKQGMQLLSMNWNEDFTFHNLHLLIRHLDQVNNLKGNGRIRLEVFRKDGGLYTPESNDVNYLIEADSLDEKAYVMNETGLRVDLFKEASRPLNKLSTIKSSNAILSVMAGIERRKSGYDDLVLFNAEGNVAEAISSNIFLVARGEVSTPAADQGCVAGVMRSRILEILRATGVKCHEKKITLHDLLHADEVFLTNAIEGIRWVGAIRNKRYFNSFTRTLLNRIPEPDQKKV